MTDAGRHESKFSLRTGDRGDAARGHGVRKWVPYAEYADVADAFVPRLPCRWSLHTFKRVLVRNDGGVWGDDPDGDDDTIVLRSTDQTADGRWSVSEPATRRLSHADRVAAALQAGDLVVTKSSGSALHIGKTTIVTREQEEQRCCFSNFMQRLRVRADIAPRLAWYFVNSEFARKQLGVLSTSTTGLANLNGTMIGQLGFPLPPPQEQRSIVTFLDRETARIDALIEKKTRFIELLREKRQAQTTESISRGLDPRAPMKDSGKAFIGNLPAHWSVKPLKYLAGGMTVGIVVNPSNYVADDGRPYVYGGDISEGSVDLQTCRRISDEHSCANAKTRLRAGDLITVRVGAPGVTAVVPPDAEGGNCASVMLIRRGEFDSDWLCFVMNSRLVRYQVELVQYGAAQEQFNISHAVDFLIPVPPADEQRLLAEVLRARTARLDGMTRRTERSIDLLRERRAALITAAVTGQIDARAEQPAENLEPA